MPRLNCETWLGSVHFCFKTINVKSTSLTSYFTALIMLSLKGIRSFGVRKESSYYDGWEARGYFGVNEFFSFIFQGGYESIF